ncbi:hypothetical protein IEN85_00240 [Pelagicoccus sp. NFK12]|uniref:Uncharacterized protein n=1 Tax=Pelagicoccus enzymogenes TaxID=2773457 RepID=A0A927F682_9BACT|nr:hypothetical protein [Pelagicoccus enzymogenes]MBD5777920.1 hypothetical protein [Pelagicoccus enzymogenes]
MLKLFFISALVSLMFATASAQPGSQFIGTWVIDSELSTAFDPWRSIQLDIELVEGGVVIEELCTTGRRRSTQRYELKLGSSQNVVPIEMWTGNRHIGAYIGGDRAMRIDARLDDGGRTLVLDCRYLLDTSQGETAVRSHKEFRVSSDGDQLVVMELRSTRPRPILQVFNKAN